MFRVLKVTSLTHPPEGAITPILGQMNFIGEIYFLGQTIQQIHTES